MFILPPPPKYYSNGGLPHNLPVLEATNSRTVLDGKIQNFSAPEGVYQAQDCVFLATPLPHPSDPPPVIINPLAPTINLPSTHSSGVKVSTLVMRRVMEKTANGHSNGQPNGGGSNGFGSAANTKRKPSLGTNRPSFGGMSSWTSSLFSQSPGVKRAGSTATATSGNGPEPHHHPSSQNGSNIVSGSDITLESSASLDSGGSSSTNSLPLANVLSNASAGTLVFNSGNLSSANAAKRPKPKNNLSKNNSSFISRTIVHENLSKRLSEHSPDDVFIWANVGRSLSWLDLSSASPTSKHEPLTKILFTKSHPLCHDVNYVNASMQNMEVVIGTSSGDTIWIDAVSNRYNRLNKNGDVTRSAVTAIKWIPGSESFFLTAHADGTLVIFDKERDDGGFTTLGLGSSQDARSTDTFKIVKSFHSSSSSLAGLSGNSVGGTAANGEKNIGAASRQNPIAVYKVSNSPLTSLEFSPNSEILAVTGIDGYLRLLDLANEQMYDIFPSYYGGFICTAFSPDGEYFATGGQDDMVCIYSVRSRSLVARLQGHMSWVRQVRFDPWGSDSDNYRLGSIGEDGTLLLWDFSPKTLTRPKATSQKKTHTKKQSLSYSQQNEEQQASEESDMTPTNTAASSSKHSVGKSVLHSFISQYDTPILPPVVKKTVHVSEAEPEPLSDLIFLERTVTVVGKDGRLWTWERPQSA